MKKDTAEFYEQAAAAASKGQTANAIDWRKFLHRVEELPEGEPEWIVEGFMQEGIAFFGSLAGVAKTWLSLALCQALTTGTPFLDVFPVPRALPCIYLCPEMGAKAFRARCEKLGLGGDSFRIQTIADGAPLKLTGELLEAAVTELKPCVVVLDTAIRFNPAKDENASAENNSGLARGIFHLISIGALGVVADHHSPKASDGKKMTLENVLRGTGDLGAIADVVWGIQHDGGSENKSSQRLGRCSVECVKARDFWPQCDQFRIQLRPHIDQRGKIAMLEQETILPLKERIDAALAENPRISKNSLAKKLGVTTRTLTSKAFEYGWDWVADEKNDKVGTWTRVTI
jgi:hypothetical protein